MYKKKFIFFNVINYYIYILLGVENKNKLKM